MARIRNFKGKVDLSKLSTADLASITTAFSKIEKLARKGLVEFQNGDFYQSAKSNSLKPEQKTVLRSIQGRTNFTDILNETGMSETKLQNNLLTLVRMKRIHKIPNNRNKTRGRLSRYDNSYEVVKES